MAIEIKAPAFPESIADGEVAIWHKAEGDFVKRDELLVAIETDKVMMDVVAPEPGVLAKILVAKGETIESGALLAFIEPGSVETVVKSETSVSHAPKSDESVSPGEGNVFMGPAARVLVDEYKLDASQIKGSGRGGRITKEDVLAHLTNKPTAKKLTTSASTDLPIADGPISERVEKRVPMTRMRARIAERLLDATQQTAMLTTFNEVDMTSLMSLRKQYKDRFEKTHNGTRLGFMGFFVKACCETLKRFPAVNASIDGNDVVYHGYQDVGVAVSTEDGLVVPVLRDADFMSIADVEAAIRDLGLKARDKKLTIEEMTGGTFTVSNGGVFGSLLSTPILNPPQTAILGMHTIQERPVAIDGQVVIRPMMYLALSYDHRLIDGKTAVQFLVMLKGLIEDPARMLLQL